MVNSQRGSHPHSRTLVPASSADSPLLPVLCLPPPFNNPAPPIPLSLLCPSLPIPPPLLRSGSSPPHLLVHARQSIPQSPLLQRSVVGGGPMQLPQRQLRDSDATRGGPGREDTRQGSKGARGEIMHECQEKCSITYSSAQRRHLTARCTEVSGRHQTMLHWHPSEESSERMRISCNGVHPLPPNTGDRRLMPIGASMALVP